MKITRNNYEIYFIDFQDGNLPPEDIRELKTFLLMNPDLEGSLYESGKVSLPFSPVSFPNKEILKKDLCHECPDYYSIAAAENTLTDKDRKVLGNRLNTPPFEALTQTYRTLKLKPDTNIRFEKKSNLYRKNDAVARLYRVAGVAAAILIAWGIYFISQQKPEQVIVAEHLEETTVLSISKPDSVILRPEPIRTEIQKEKIVQKEKDNAYTKKPETLAIEPLTPIPSVVLPLIMVTNHVSPQPLGLIFPEDLDSREIFLSENANNWRQSEPGFFSDNIFMSAIHTGKNLKEKIKERIDLYRSNKSPLLSVIQQNINNTKTHEL